MDLSGTLIQTNQVQKTFFRQQGRIKYKLLYDIKELLLIYCL